MDKDGALTADRRSKLTKEQRDFMRYDVPAGTLRPKPKPETLNPKP
jgi:hypothetical protein